MALQIARVQRSFGAVENLNGCFDSSDYRQVLHLGLPAVSVSFRSSISKPVTLQRSGEIRIRIVQPERTVSVFQQKTRVLVTRVSTTSAETLRGPSTPRYGKNPLSH